MVEKLLASMRKALDDEMKIGLFSYHDSDFTKFDSDTLKKNADASFRWIWVVTPNGTHLSRIGVSEQGNSWALATLSTGYKNFSVYLINGFSLKKITAERAKVEAKLIDFELKNDCSIYLHQKKLAKFVVKKVQAFGEMPHYELDFTMSEISSQLISAVTEIGCGHVHKTTGSFFTQVKKITINGRDQDEVLQDLANSSKETRRLELAA